MNPLTLQPEEELPIRTDDISRAEIRSAIKSLKTGKATGADNIPSEAIQARGVVGVSRYHVQHPQQVLEERRNPRGMEEGIQWTLIRKLEGPL